MSTETKRIALTEREAGERIGFSFETMRRWRRLGTGPKFIRIGGPSGPVRYLTADLVEWLESQRHVSRGEEVARHG